jgi:(aminoalkyl)phosphonate N-acetyltransferase
MEANINIRPAAPADGEIIYHFICHLEEKHFDPEDFNERYKFNLGKTDTIYLVAVSESDEVIGFLGCQGQSVLHHEGKIFEIQEFYVARPHRGKGIGRDLLGAVEEKLRKTGAEILEVSTHAKRTEARRFYAKLGFASTHVKMVKEI